MRNARGTKKCATMVVCVLCMNNRKGERRSCMYLLTKLIRNNYVMQCNECVKVKTSVHYTTPPEDTEWER